MIANLNIANKRGLRFVKK